MYSRVLKKLVNNQEEACITVLQNIHMRYTPEHLEEQNQWGVFQEHIEQKAQKIIDKIRMRFSNYASPAIFEKLKMVADLAIYQPGARAFAFFISEKVFEFVWLPFKVTERTVLDQSFEVRELFKADQQLVKWQLLVLSHQSPRVIRGQGEQMQTLFNASIEPENQPDQQGYQAWVLGIDQLFAPYIENNLPLVLMGTHKAIGHYKKYGKHAHLVAHEVPFASDNIRFAEFPHYLKDFYTKIITEKEQGILNTLGYAQGHNQIITDLNQLWEATYHGRVKLIVAADDYISQAVLLPNGLLAPPNTNAKNGHQLMDVVDDLFELAYRRGSQFYQMPAQKLPNGHKLMGVIK